MDDDSGDSDCELRLMFLLILLSDSRFRRHSGALATTAATTKRTPKKQLV